jgi:hypothetical protein
VEHAEVAYIASRSEAASTCGREVWVPPPTDSLPQKVASFEIDKAKLKRLIEEAPNDRERHRLQRLTCEHAGAWVSAVPSSVDGFDTIMRSRQFMIAAQVRLGCVVASGGLSCSLCEQTFDSMGDHGSCCRKTGDNTSRHNRVRDLVARIASEGLLSPVLEKKGILGDNQPGRRPGDVTIPYWTNGMGLAVDVAVTSPFSIVGLRSSEPCEAYALKKHSNPSHVRPMLSRNTPSTTPHSWMSSSSSPPWSWKPPGASTRRARTS